MIFFPQNNGMNFKLNKILKQSFWFFYFKNLTRKPVDAGGAF